MLMKKNYVVAKNAFSVSVPDSLAGWKVLKPRFDIFAGPADETPVLDIEIREAPLPKHEAKMLYEPGDGGVGFITGVASELADGSLLMEFRHINEAKPRVQMKMPPELNRAEIIITPDGDANDSFFLTHAVMLAFMLATCGNGTLVIHSSSVVYDGKAYLFQGKSGTGKSTHARLWTENISGAELLNDDHPIIRFAEGTAVAYGSPWSGKTHCYRNVSAPIGAFVRIVRADENELRTLPPLKGYASLTASVFYLPFLSERVREVRHRTIERLVREVRCCEMHCRPDAEAAEVCRAGLAGL